MPITTLKRILYSGADLIVFCIMINLILGLLIYNKYDIIIQQVDYFVSKEFKNNIIVDTDRAQYRPGKGLYKQIFVEGDSIPYPILVGEAQNTEKIVPGSYIYKAQNSRQFIISNSSGKYQFTLFEERRQRSVLMGFIFLFSVGASTIIISQLLKEKKKKI